MGVHVHADKDNSDPLLGSSSANISHSLKLSKEGGFLLLLFFLV